MTKRKNDRAQLLAATHLLAKENEIRSAQTHYIHDLQRKVENLQEILKSVLVLIPEPANEAVKTLLQGSDWKKPVNMPVPSLSALEKAKLDFEEMANRV